MPLFSMLVSEVQQNLQFIITQELHYCISKYTAFHFSGPNAGRTAEQHDAGKTGSAEESSLHC